MTTFNPALPPSKGAPARPAGIDVVAGDQVIGQLEIATPIGQRAVRLSFRDELGYLELPLSRRYSGDGRFGPVALADGVEMADLLRCAAFRSL